MADLHETRRTRLVWMLTLFLLVAFCGFILQWINYRVVKVVDEYETQRTHMSRIRMRSFRPLWTREELEIVNAGKLKNLKQNGDQKGEDQTIDSNLKLPRLRNADTALEPEVVKWPLSETGGDSNGIKEQRKLKRRKWQEFGEQVNLGNRINPGDEEDDEDDDPTLSSSEMENEMQVKPTLSSAELLENLYDAPVHTDRNISETKSVGVMLGTSTSSSSLDSSEDKRIQSSPVAPLDTTVTDETPKTIPSAPLLNNKLQTESTNEETNEMTQKPKISAVPPSPLIVETERNTENFDNPGTALKLPLSNLKKKVTFSPSDRHEFVETTPEPPVPNLERRDQTSLPDTKVEITKIPMTSNETTIKLVPKKRKEKSVAQGYQKHLPLSELVKLSRNSSVGKNEEQGTLNSSWSSPRLLNIPDFKWLMNNESLCKIEANDSSPTRLIAILVHSARENFKARQAIRNSWGSTTFVKNWHIRLAFLLGGANPNTSKDEMTPKEQTQNLQVEQQKYGDLILGSFVDSFKTLSYKHLMGYKWILNFCENANFIMKVNDNIFVDLPRWTDLLNSEYETKDRNSTQNSSVQASPLSDFYCKVKKDLTPVREGQYAVSKEEWSLEKYPDFCHRWAYGASIDAIRKLYSVSNIPKIFWKDEIFVTGLLKILAEKSYDWKPVTKDITELVSPILPANQVELLGELCRKSDWEATWPLYPVTFLQPDESLGKNMMCLWKKTMHDTNKKHNNKNDEDVDDTKKIDVTTEEQE